MDVVTVKGITYDRNKRTEFQHARPGDLFWSIVDGDWHVIRKVTHKPDPLFGDTYRIQCAGTINPVIAAGGPRATLEP